MPRLDQLEKLLKIDPNDAFVLYGIAHEHANLGAHDRAIEFYDRCLAVDPSYCYAYYHKARSLESSGRSDDAAVVIRAGIEASKKAGDAHAVSELQGLLSHLS
jgi:tetratricopeptide (TPR) repeat protein